MPAEQYWNVFHRPETHVVDGVKRCPRCLRKGVFGTDLDRSRDMSEAHAHDQSSELGRIAQALERIADALERDGRR